MRWHRRRTQRLATVMGAVQRNNRGVLSVLETLLNRAVALDPQAARMLEPLAGRCIDLTLSGFNSVPLRLCIDGQRVRLSWHLGAASVVPADLRISGSMAALVGALSAPRATSGALPQGVQIHGDLEVARQLLFALRGLQPDLEEALSQLVGDTLARQLGIAGRGLLHGVQTAAVQAMRNAGEALVHEQQLLAASTDQQYFSEEVHELRDSVARLEARIALLEAHSGRVAC